MGACSGQGCQREGGRVEPDSDRGQSTRNRRKWVGSPVGRLFGKGRLHGRGADGDPERDQAKLGRAGTWADLRADERYGQLLRLVVGNSGPTVATRVTVTFDPPLTDIEMPSDGIHLGEAVLRHGLASLPPGRQVAWSGGFTGTFFTENAESPLSWEVTINADGPFGPLEPLTYTIDLKGLEQSNAAPPGTLHGVAEELKEVRKQLKTLTELGKAAYTVARERDRQPGSPEA